MPRQGARISLILAFVFPAIVCATLALSTYGFRYARSASERSKASLMDGNRQLAQALAGSIQQRIDTADFELFKEVEWDDSTEEPPADIEMPKGVESVALLDKDLRIREILPPTSSDAKKRGRELERWQNYVRGLDWKSLQPWTPAQPGNFRHLHQLFDGRSVLIAYAAKESETGEEYFVAARMNLALIAKEWLPEEIRELGGDRKIAILDEVARPIFGQPVPQRDQRFLYESSFGKTLYAWRIQTLPKNVDELQAQAETERLLGVLLIPVSTLIIAVGLAIVLLTVAAERRTSRMKSDFIANVSHELKTPLSLIRMFGELLATGKHKGADSPREYAEIITREAERLSHLIDNVLDFARIERGKASYDFTEGRLDDVIERALDVARYRVEKEKMRLRTEIQPGLPPVRMDENAMTLVVLNLVDNAVKYASEGKEIDVRLLRTPGGVTLSVRDNGPGIPLDEQPRIFERFYRARTARDRNVRGSGIGLALVKHIVEAHGGRLAVESAPGQGATFTVALPAAPVTVVESASQVAAEAAGDKTPPIDVDAPLRPVKVKS
ncbi:MAG TPA: HAMP domain-containing sensor histidine kinase [Polyangia bacterium]|jgi:two-component system phosphate regulon sensor histidine kinase PhoR